MLLDDRKKIRLIINIGKTKYNEVGRLRGMMENGHSRIV